MNFLDIRRALTEKISSLGYSVRYDDINKVIRPCFFIDIVDYQKELKSKYCEWKKIDFDILYFPKTQEGDITEIYTALEDLDNSFDYGGNKIFQVENETKDEKRHLTMKDVTLNEIDKVGHYQFTIEFYDNYGKRINYELMKELEVRNGE